MFLVKKFFIYFGLSVTRKISQSLIRLSFCAAFMSFLNMYYFFVCLVQVKTLFKVQYYYY